MFFQTVDEERAGWVALEVLKRQRKALLETLELRGAVSFSRVANIFFLAEQIAARLARAGKIDFDGFKQFAFLLNSVCSTFKDMKQTAKARSLLTLADTGSRLL